MLKEHREGLIRGNEGFCRSIFKEGLEKRAFPRKGNEKWSGLVGYICKERVWWQVRLKSWRSEVKHFEELVIILKAVGMELLWIDLEYLTVGAGLIRVEVWKLGSQRYSVGRTKVLCTYWEWKIGDLDCHHMSEVARISIWGWLVSTRGCSGRVHRMYFTVCTSQLMTEHPSGTASACHLVFREWKERSDRYPIAVGLCPHSLLPNEVCVAGSCGLRTVFTRVVL